MKYSKNCALRTLMCALFVPFSLLAVMIPQASAGELPRIGAQVFIEPGQSSENIESWFRLLEEQHMPVCRIRMFEDHMKTDDGNWDFSLYDTAFDHAQKHGVRIVATLFPSDESVGGFKFPRDEAHLESIRRYIHAVVNHFKTYPALDAWVLQNEPGIGDIPTEPYAKAWYSRWEKSRPATEISKGFLKKDISPLYFWRDYSYWFLDWIAKEISSLDDAHGLHVNNHALFSNLVQYDFPRWMDFLSTLGASIHASWHLGMFRRDQYSLAIAANCDIIRDGSQPKPFWVTELQGGNNIFSGMNPLCPSVQDISQWLWTCVGSGAKRTIYWTLNPRATGAEAGEWSLITFQNQPSERLFRSGEIAQIIEKHSKFFQDAKPNPSKISLLYSPETMWMYKKEILSNRFSDNYAGRKTGAHIKSILAYYEALNEMGVSPSVQQMDSFDWSSRDKKDETVILANMMSISSSDWPELKQFVSNGNKLILTGMTGYFDEHMHAAVLSSDPFMSFIGASLSEYFFIGETDHINVEGDQRQLPIHMLKGVIHNESAEVFAEEQNQILGVRKKIGEGEVVWIPSLVGLGAWNKDNEPLIDFLESECEESLEKMPVRFAEDRRHVYMRTLATGQKMLTVLINQGKEKTSVELVQIENKEAELIDGSAIVDGKVIELPAGETAVLLWQ